MSSILEATVFDGKELLRKFYIPSKMIGNDLTLKQMFDICKS